MALSIEVLAERSAATHVAFLGNGKANAEAAQEAASRLAATSLVAQDTARA
jgi:hypothetical protein